MNAILSPLLRHWHAVAFLASAALLAAAHWFEAQGYAPCTLCLVQRKVHWVVIGVAALALIVGRTRWGPRTARAFDALLTVIFLVSVWQAFHHAGVEWKWWPGPETCASTATGVSADQMSALLGGEEIKPPACDEPVWFFLGLSMAVWNGLISLALAALGAMAALRRGKA